MARHDLSDLSDHDLARLLGAKGRYGDTAVVHVNPQEISLLKMLGGSGTRNPKTGLLEFFAGGPGGVGRDGGGAVAGGASGIGGRGASGNGVSGNGGRGNENSATGSRSASQRDSSYGGGYSGGMAAGGSSGGLGAAYGRLGMGLGLDGQPASGPAPVSPDTAMAQKAVAQPGFNASPYAKGLGMALSATGIGAPLGGIIGIADALGAFDDIGGTSITAARDAARGSTSNSSGGSIGGVGGGRGDSGGLPGDHSTVAQSAQQANAGGGLLAALNPAGQPTTPGLPPGLLQYLAANPGLLQGLVTNSRFGTGTVAPISYGQPLA